MRATGFGVESCLAARPSESGTRRRLYGMQEMAEAFRGARADLFQLPCQRIGLCILRPVDGARADVLPDGLGAVLLQVRVLHLLRNAEQEEKVSLADFIFLFFYPTLRVEPPCLDRKSVV